jgi:hypothetical protein
VTWPPTPARIRLDGGDRPSQHRLRPARSEVAGEGGAGDPGRLVHRYPLTRDADLPKGIDLPVLVLFGRRTQASRSDGIVDRPPAEDEGRSH